MLIAAALLLALGTALAVSASHVVLTPQQEAANAAIEERVFSELRPVLPDEECVPPGEATRRIDILLDKMGLMDWSVWPNPEAAQARCVMAGVSAETKQVVLVGRLDPGLSAAMRPMADHLLTGCYNRAEAVELVRTRLAELGITEFAVTTDGPKVYPPDEQDTYAQHVAAGCFVYVSLQFAGDRTGGLVVYLTGP